MMATCNTDVSNIDYVINYDFPNYTEDYVHRIGRTARAEKTGTAYTFFTSESDKQVGELLKVLQDAKQEVNPQLLQFVKQPKSHLGESKFAHIFGGCSLTSFFVNLQEVGITVHVHAMGRGHVIHIHVTHTQTEVIASISRARSSFKIVIMLLSVCKTFVHQNCHSISIRDVKNDTLLFIDRTGS